MNESAEKLEKVQVCGKTGVINSKQKLLDFLPITFINELITCYSYELSSATISSGLVS